MPTLCATKRHSHHRTHVERKNREAKTTLAALINVLGGRCASPFKDPRCTLLERLEVDHVDGREWRLDGVKFYQRIERYLDEYKRGVRLRVLCRSCNAIDGNVKKNGKRPKLVLVPIVARSLQDPGVSATG